MTQPFLFVFLRRMPRIMMPPIKPARIDSIGKPGIAASPPAPVETTGTVVVIRVVLVVMKNCVLAALVLVTGVAEVTVVKLVEVNTVDVIPTLFVWVEVDNAVTVDVTVVCRTLEISGTVKTVLPV